MTDAFSTISEFFAGLSRAGAWVADPAHAAGLLVAVLLIVFGTWAVIS